MSQDKELTMDELEEIRKKKLRELQRQYEAEEVPEAEYEAQRRDVLRRLLTPDARERLANFKLARPQLGAALESRLIELAASGRPFAPIDDQQMRQILAQASNRREPRITRR